MKLKELLKLIKGLVAQGYATKSDKDKVAVAFKGLEEDEKEVVEEKVEEVNDLPEEKDGEDEVETAKGLIKSIVDKTMGESVEAMKSEIKEYMKSQADLVSKKSGIYSKEAQEKREGLNAKLRQMVGLAVSKNAKDILAFNKENWLENKKLKEITTDATGSPYAGYVVDSELSAEIRHLMTEYGVARREMTSLQLTKGSYKANNLTTDLTVYWVDEGAAIKSSEVVIGQETLELVKLAVIVSFTSELLEDEEIDLASFVTSRVAENFAEAEDEAFFNGDGTSTYGGFTGLLQNTSINEVTMTGSTFASLDADDLLAMIDATPQGAQANSKFYMQRTIMSLIRKLKEDNGDYIYQRPSEAGPATIWGKPAVMVEVMPSTSDTAAATSFILYGDLKKACILGYKGAIKIDRFNGGTIRNVANSADINLITTDREAIRYRQRSGFIVIIPTAVTKLTTAAASA